MKCLQIATRFLTFLGRVTAGSTETLSNSEAHCTIFRCQSITKRIFSSKSSDFNWISSGNRSSLFDFSIQRSKKLSFPLQMKSILLKNCWKVKLIVRNELKTSLTRVVEHVDPRVWNHSVLSSSEHSTHAARPVLPLPQQSVLFQIPHNTSQKGILALQHLQRLTNTVPQTRQTCLKTLQVNYNSIHSNPSLTTGHWEDSENNEAPETHFNGPMISVHLKDIKSTLISTLVSLQVP